jgi:CRISPR-associated protein Cas2
LEIGGDIMLVLITYDVSTTSAEGRRRLNKVAKKCLDYGQRVQNSVFECVIDSTQLKQVKYQLEEIINKQTDSLRFYNLGDKYKSKVDHIGAKGSYDIEGPLFL